MSKEKELGQVYTPAWIVDEILNLVGYKGENLLNKYILEPSCGDGAFLQEIVRRYVNTCREQNVTDEAIISGLETYIIGVEIDVEEWKKCIVNLDKIVVDEFSLPAPKWQIFNGNTLILYKNYISKFDFIVGNPPYIRIHNLDIETREYIKKNFLFADGTIDIYLAFFEIGFKMLNTSGMLGYITPNSYLHNSSYKRFREYLKSRKFVHTLIDFKANKLFKGISTYTAISIFENNYGKDYFNYKELENNEIHFVNKIYFDKLDNKDWSFANDENTTFLERLSSNFTNSIDVQYGFATLRDKIFVGKIESIEESDIVLFNGVPIEKSILKTVVKGSRFKGNIDENDKIIFPYEWRNGKYYAISEKKLEREFPHCYAYFLSQRNELESRDIDKGAAWYEYGRSQGVQTIHNEKIILSTLVNDRIDFYKVPKDVLMYSGIFIIRKNLSINWSLIENTLKSEDFFKYLRLTGKDFSGGYKSVTTKQIKDFKIDYKNPQTLF